MDILGIDVSKRDYHVALKVGERVLRRKFANTPTGHRDLLDWLAYKGVTRVHACMEATGNYGGGVRRGAVSGGTRCERG